MSLSEVNSEEELVELQRVFFDIIRRPLLPEEKMAPDDRVGDFIRGNTAMHPHERLELYAQQYWWRLIGSLMDDFPVTRALLKKEKFRVLCEQYLVHYPSKAYSLRFLGGRFPEFIREAPELTAPLTDLCYDTARLEAAIGEVFLAPEGEPLGPEYLQAPPTELTFSLKPALRALELSYPAHRLVSEELLKMKMGRGDTSNVLSALQEQGDGEVSEVLHRSFCTVVVHRRNFSVYFKELSRFEFRLLSLLGEGQTLATALSSEALEGLASDDTNIAATFQEWVALGWLCPS